MKQKVKKFGAFCGRLACTIVGLAIAGYGVSYFIPHKKYSNSAVDVQTPPTRIDEDVEVK